MNPTSVSAKQASFSSAELPLNKNSLQTSSFYFSKGRNIFINTSCT